MTRRLILPKTLGQRNNVARVLLHFRYNNDDMKSAEVKNPLNILGLFGVIYYTSEQERLIMSEGRNVELWERIYLELSKPIPIDAVQTKDFGDKAQGYNIAYLIDRLNSVLTDNGCSWEQVLLPLGDDEFGNERLFIRDTFSSEYKGRVTEKTSISVRLKINIKDDKGYLLETKESFGGCQYLNGSLGDTLKGAQTDAMKKVFSYFGLGDEAYKGSIHNQLRGFKYRLNKLVERTEDVLKKTYNIETLSHKKLIGYFCSVVEKEYDNLNNLTELDITLISEDLNKLEKQPPNKKKTSKKKKVVDEPTSPSGEDQVPPTEEQVDNPF